MSRLAEWWRTHRGAVLIAGAVIAALGIAAALIWPITDLIAAHDVGRLVGPQGAAQLQTAREAVRTQLLTLAAGVFVAGALWFEVVPAVVELESGGPPPEACRVVGHG